MSNSGNCTAALPGADMVMVPAPHTLRIHSYFDDQVLPYVGQLIKIRLTNPLPGPGSLVSSSALSRATPYNYHSAVVVAVFADFPNRCLNINVLPVPAYSKAPNSCALVAQLSPSELKKYIPMPSVHPNQTCDHHQSAPVEFGSPVRPVTTLNGQTVPYLDRRPSWILIDQQIVTLPFNSAWKSFNPDVSFPLEQVQQLMSYLGKIELANVTVNMMHVPDVYLPEQEWALGSFTKDHPYIRDIYGVLSGNAYEFESHNDEDEDEDEDDPEYSIVEFLRMIDTKDPGLRQLIEKDDERLREEKKSWIHGWLGDVSGSDALG